MKLRLLHTADWHLGHSLHGLDRTGEHADFLAWLLDTLESESVDGLLVAGDIFDAANPPATALAAWYGFLVDAWKRLPRLQIVVVGGNHDSASRLEAPHPFHEAMGRVRVVGGLPRVGGQPDVERLIVPLAGADGRTAAFAVAVPFLRPADLPPAPAGDDGTALAAGVRGVYAQALAAARDRARAGEALVALGHLYLAGGQLSELSERKILGGNLHALSDDLFPSDVAYAALGHLHLAQPVGGREHVRYSGSPLPLSFAERDYAHQVVVAELDGRECAVRSVRVPVFRELRRLPAGGPAPLAQVLAELAALPSASALPESAWPWVEVLVELSEPEPGLRSMLEKAAEGRAARLVRIPSPRLTGSGRPLAEAAPERTLADLGPEDVFRRKWERDHRSEPPPEVLAAFHELLDALFREERAA